jgi:hypothetical protein
VYSFTIRKGFRDAEDGHGGLGHTVHRLHLRSEVGLVFESMECFDDLLESEPGLHLSGVKSPKSLALSEAHRPHESQELESFESRDVDPSHLQLFTIPLWVWTRSASPLVTLGFPSLCASLAPSSA